jgi:hypothetical protein
LDYKKKKIKKYWIIDDDEDGFNPRQDFEGREND